MKHAVIAISGSQFKVTEDQKLSVANLNIKEGEKSVHPYLNEKNIKYYPTHYHYRFMKNMSSACWTYCCPGAR